MIHQRLYLLLFAVLVAVPACAIPLEREGDSMGECEDNQDNDSDGAIDCDDLDCVSAPPCTRDPTDSPDTDDDDDDDDGEDTGRSVGTDPADVEPGEEQEDDPCHADPMRCWPNSASQANSDPWLSRNHDQLIRMRPRFLLINFANGLGTGGNDQLEPGFVFSQADLEAKGEAFLHQLSESSRYQPALNSDAPAFLEPELVRVVDLQDNNGHANSNAFPRGQVVSNTPGYQTVGYYELFSEAFAPHWGYRENGRYLTLGEIVDAGYVHEIIMMANQVDGHSPNPPGQVTSSILEVAFVAQAWDQSLNPIPGEFVKNGTSHNRQKANMAYATEEDHNSMPWTGRSLRIYFLNASRGVGCLAHSLGHDFEYRYNDTEIYSPGSSHNGQPLNPYLQPKFREFAGFDMDSRYGAPFDSLYAGGDDYSYTSCNGSGVCDNLAHPQGTIRTYRPVCGNTHYPPGAAYGYDYLPVDAVRSSCENYGKPGAQAEVFDSSNWDYLGSDPSIDNDCGGEFLTYWYQNMPGLDNDARNGSDPMKNWWPFMYY
jgi:hypothetical protein